MAKILIVDDDPDVVEATSLFLEREGHQVVGAGNREEGMAAFEQERPDLLILDVMMEQPDDGLAMARELRRKGSTVPILMLTSINLAIGMRYGKDDEMVPVDEFQEKPIEPAALLAKVSELLGRKEGRSRVRNGA